MEKVECVIPIWCRCPWELYRSSQESKYCKSLCYQEEVIFICLLTKLLCSYSFLCFHPLLCLHKALCSPRGKNSNKKSARRVMYRFLSLMIVRVLCLMLNGWRKLKVSYQVSKLIVTTILCSWRIDISVLLSDQVWITNESNNSKKNDKDKELAVMCQKKLSCRNWYRKWNKLTNLLNHTIG